MTIEILKCFPKMDYFQWNGEDLECEKFKITTIINNPEFNNGNLYVNNSILLDDPQAEGSTKYNEFCPQCGEQIKYHGVMKSEDLKECLVLCPKDYIVFSELLYPDNFMQCENMSADRFNKIFNRID